MVEKSFPPTFREEDTAYFIKRALASETTLLLGLPGIGKSTFLRFLAYNSHLRETYKKEWEKIVVILLDTNELPEISALQFYRLVLRRLTKVLKSERINATDPLLLLEEIKKAISRLHRERKSKIVLIIDRFGQLCQRLETPFFNNLKAIKDEAKGFFSYLLATTTDPKEPSFVEKTEQLLTPIIPFTYHLQPLTIADSHLVVDNTLKESFFTLADFQKERIYRLCGGHPGLTKTFIQLAKLKGKAAAWETLLGEVEKSEAVTAHLERIWDSLEKEEKKTAEKIALNESLNREERGSLLLLIKKGVLKKQNGEVYFPSKLFEDFVKTKQIRKKERFVPQLRRGIFIDEKNRRVFKNGLELEQPLTKKEYTLLSFFLKNAGKICHRDEVAAAVWKEKVTSRVSDEAIDQLILRLRAKIEDEKSNPRHILTVHGRGFMFSHRRDSPPPF